MAWFRAAGIVLGLATAASCAAGTAHRTTAPMVPLEAELRAQVTTRSGVPWSASKPLAWTDFKAVAPRAGSEGARTAYILVYGTRCRGTAFQFLSTAAFLPNESWVKPVVLANAGENRRTLDHEQTHFNLTEVYARRMRKYFAGMYNPCGQTEEGLRTAAERIVADEAAEQAHYDQETEHGLTAARQLAWDRSVAEMLASLGAFDK